MKIRKTCLLLSLLCLFFASLARAQQGAPITVGPTPVFIYSPGRATSVTITQIAGLPTAFVIYTRNREVLSQQLSGATYTFVPAPPATNFTLGEPIGMISIPTGTSTFRPTAVAPSVGSITGSGAINQVAVFSSASNINGSTNLTFNASTGTFTVIAPSQPASIILGVAAANPLTIQTRNVGQLLITLGTGAQLNLDQNGLALVGDGNLASTVFTLNSIGGGSASIGVGSFATNPARMNLPTTTGSANQVLTTNGANPQQLSWTTPASGISGLTTGFLPVATSATTLGNSLCDSGITTANTFTCSNTVGAHFVSVSTGTSPPSIAAGSGGVMGGGEGTTPTGFSAGADWLWENAASHCMDLINNGVDKGCLSTTTTSTALIASGTTTLASASIPGATCATAVTTAAVGTATTDSIEWAYATAPSLTTDGLFILNPYVTSGNVNFTLCNPGAAAHIPTGLVVNWRVIR
jgi:hypothetical protein